MRSPSAPRARFRDALAVAGILAVTFLAFFPVLRNGFVNWDDPDVFLRNAQLGGPNVARWAFTTTHMGHYQPISWLMWSEVQVLFGLNAGAFHALSLLGHLLNAALVYVVCRRLAALAGLDVRSRRVAATGGSLVFAVHPIRVEAVAWASAFPYVLSLTFLLVALLSYLSYCGSAGVGSAFRRTSGPARAGPERAWFALSIGSYALSQLTRASAIAFPLVLLAVDVYPLRRRIASRAVLLEKLPFLLLAGGAAVAESRARELATLQEVGAGARITMAATAPFIYLGRTLLPGRLTPLDPLPIAPRLEWAALVLSVAGLAAITIAVWKARRTWPALPVAWIGYLLLLGPVIGLTPSGQQATADRYMYIPGVIVSLLIGVAIARIDGVCRAGLYGPPARHPVKGRPAAVAMNAVGPVVSPAVMLTLAVALGVPTWHQTRWWHDSITLWSRTADLDPRNDIATYNLASALAETGREDEAIRRYEQTLRLVPDHEFAQHNLDLIRAAQAEREGDRLAQAGDLDAAIDQYARALAFDSTRLHARTARGMSLVQRERFAEAAAELQVAFDTAVRLKPDPTTEVRLKPDATPNATSERIRSKDDLAVANALAFALVQTARHAEAAAVLKQALARYPDNDQLAHNLARLLATTPDPAVRDGALALRLALAVRDQTGGRDPRVLDTLAAAYAATRDLDLARKTAAEAAALAEQRGDTDLARQISNHARTYRRQGESRGPIRKDK